MGYKVIYSQKTDKMVGKRRRAWVQGDKNLEQSHGNKHESWVLSKGAEESTLYQPDSPWTSHTLALLSNHLNEMRQ